MYNKIKLKVTFIHTVTIINQGLDGKNYSKPEQIK